MSIFCILLGFVFFTKGIGDYDLGVTFPALKFQFPALETMVLMTSYLEKVPEEI
jgi:hypothetical protein